ncbi:hypothetical protein CRG98_033301 [Punica granatum]|uniref:Uncharacterized protein n=1 Tax=Punica granatum TaxID=22663 RepID=A0A2I0IQQ6_PUNGR|nr:hypothetical protein CRG98_033301 [Punica granatum]
MVEKGTGSAVVANPVVTTLQSGSPTTPAMANDLDWVDSGRSRGPYNRNKKSPNFEPLSISTVRASIAATTTSIGVANHNRSGRRQQRIWGEGRVAAASVTTTADPSPFFRFFLFNLV